MLKVWCWWEWADIRPVLPLSMASTNGRYHSSCRPLAKEFVTFLAVTTNLVKEVCCRFFGNSIGMPYDDAVERKARLAQKVLAARRAIESGKLHVLPEQRSLADELLAAPLGATGLVKIEMISDAALVFAKAVGMAASFELQEEAKTCSEEIGVADSQAELFRLFARLYIALTGEQPQTAHTDQRIKKLMMDRVHNEPAVFERMVVDAMDELAAFYGRYRMSLFQHAKQLGGVKLVTGGQRRFGPSALQGIRISGLYVDTQLVPDPVYPYLVGDLHQNAKHLQLALSLSELLKLTPLVEAHLPVPPVFVFPSFEEELEQNDAWAKAGIENLAVQLIGGVCPGEFSSLDELFEFAAKHEGVFIDAMPRTGCSSRRAQIQKNSCIQPMRPRDTWPSLRGFVTPSSWTL